MAWKALTRCWWTLCGARGWRCTICRNCRRAVSFLLVEVGGWTAEDAREQAENLVGAAMVWPERPVARICTPEEAVSIWKVRDSALGGDCFCSRRAESLRGMGGRRGAAGEAGDYLRAITKLMAEYGFRSPLYGHYGQGCVHTRINFDFSSEEGMRKFREFITRAADMVIGFGGSLSGEHGDGQARAALLPKMFGPELMGAFREFKILFDPDNRMNPGKLMDAVRVYDPVENLRHSIEIQRRAGKSCGSRHARWRLTLRSRRTRGRLRWPPSGAWAWAHAAIRRAE